MTHAQLAVATACLLAATACSTQVLGIHDELYVPEVALQETEMPQYFEEVQNCRLHVFKMYKAKRDIRNVNTDFRTCLIGKGYVLLS